MKNEVKNNKDITSNLIQKNEDKNKNTTKNTQDILHSNIQRTINVKMVIDPSIRRMSITYEYNNKIITTTISGNSKKDWPTNLTKINLNIINNLRNIISETLEGGAKSKHIEDRNEEDNWRGDCAIELELYIEKPRIAQRFRGKVVEKGYAYRIHWVIGALISMISIIDKVNIIKFILVPANKWYFGLRLPKGDSEKRKLYSIEHAEYIVKEYNIEVEKLKGDEADSINMWYWLKECNWEIPTTKQNSKIMIVENRTEQDKNLKNKVRKLLNL